MGRLPVQSAIRCAMEPAHATAGTPHWLSTQVSTTKISQYLGGIHPVPGSWIHHPGYWIWILDPGSWIQDPAFTVEDPASRILAPGSRILDPGSWIEDPGTWQQVDIVRILEVSWRWIQDPGSSWISLGYWRYPGDSHLGQRPMGLKVNGSVARMAIRHLEDTGAIGSQ